MEHTPIPWSWDGVHLIGPKHKGASPWILRCAPECEPISEDATLIERAVNNHAALLETLEHIDTYTTRQVNESPKEGALWAQCASFARTALLAAKGD